MRSIVALNSGGFDSVTMLHMLKHEHPEAEIHCLHFNYGQNSHEQELSCSMNVCNKLNIPLKVIELPKMDWTFSDFYGSNFISASSQELEYRNLIFLSYAISYAVSIGADTICVAFLKASEYFKDTSPEFVRKLNRFMKSEGIKVVAPFHRLYKEDLHCFVSKYGIKYDDFFSCDTPVDGKPCGKCPDCLCLEGMFNK